MPRAQLWRPGCVGLSVWLGGGLSCGEGGSGRGSCFLCVQNRIGLASQERSAAQAQPNQRTLSASTSPCNRLAARTLAAARGSDQLAISMRAACVLSRGWWWGEVRTQNRPMQSAPHLHYCCTDLPADQPLHPLLQRLPTAHNPCHPLSPCASSGPPSV